MGQSVTDFASQILAAVGQETDLDLQEVAPAELERLAEAADGPVGAALFIWLVRHRQSDIAAPFALRILEQIWDPGTMAEIVGWLIRGGSIPQEMARPIWHILLRRAEDRKSHAGVRSHALLGVMFLSQLEKSLIRRLQGVLLDVDLTDDGSYLRHVAKIAGAVLAQVNDSDLRDLLTSLSTVTDVEDEAALELGLDALRMGLDSLDHDEALGAFQNALSQFQKAALSGEQRPDAELYRQCIGMLVAFLDGSLGDDVKSRIAGIRQGTIEYSAYLLASDRESDSWSWIGISSQQRIHWSMLAVRLGALTSSLKQQLWLQAARVIEDELLAIYSASRTLFYRRQDGGLEVLFRPTIAGLLQQHRLSLDFLDQWISENANSSLLPDATVLRKEVSEAREKSLTRNPIDAVAGSPSVAAVLERGLVPIEEHKAILARIQAQVVAFSSESTSPVITETLVRVLEELESNPDFRTYGEARALFETILYYTLCYVANRADVTVSSIPRTAFLFNRDPNNLPLEKELQSDYHDFLNGSPLGGAIHAEARNIAGGRVDVLFSARGIRIVAELKRDEHDYTHDKLVARYGLQTASYQSTNMTFGILMLLDLCDRGGGQPHLREQVSVHQITPEWGNTAYSVVFFRVQGRRKVPSSL